MTAPGTEFILRLQIRIYFEISVQNKFYLIRYNIKVIDKRHDM